MQNKNPYYLHEENQLNELEKPEPRHQHLNPQHSYNNINSEEFARENSNTKKRAQGNQLNPTYPEIYQPPQPFYQPPTYPPLPYQYPQPPQYMPYQPAPQFTATSVPLYKEYDQSSTSSRQGIADHCPYCNKVTQSYTQQKLSKVGYFICCLLLCVTLVMFWLPFCFDCFHEKRVKCVSCGRTKFVIKNGC